MNLSDLGNELLILKKEDLKEALLAFAEELEKGKNVPKQWLSVEETKKLLNIKSSTTLFKLKNEGKLVFSQPFRKILLFRHDSVMAFINNAQNKEI